MTRNMKTTGAPAGRCLAPNSRRIFLLLRLPLLILLCSLGLVFSSFLTRVGSSQGAGESVSWKNLVNAAATGGTLQKNGGCACYDAGSTSEQQITSGGSFEFSPSATHRMFVGLSSDTSASTDYSNINYAFNFWGNGDFDIREGWANWRAGGTYAAGDVFKIVVEGASVKYYKNGAEIYASNVAPTFPLVADTALVDLNATVSGATIGLGPALKYDRNAYPLPSPLPAPPAVGGSFIDPVFGTRILRATDESDGGSPGLGNYYAHWPTFNSNNTFILIRKGVYGHALIKPFDAVNFTVQQGHEPGNIIYNNVNYGQAQFESAIWHPTDPNLIYCFPASYAGGMRLFTYHVVDRVYALIKDFSGLSGGNDYLWQMSMSADGNVFAWSHVRDHSKNIVYYLVWRKTPDQVLYHTPNTIDVDEVRLDKTGKWLHLPMGTHLPDGTAGQILNVETGVLSGFKEPAPDYAPGHGDLGGGSIIGKETAHGGITWRKLSEPRKPVHVFFPATAYGVTDSTESIHASMLADNEDWITVGTYDNPALSPDLHIFEDEIFQVALDGSHRVRRICHTRSLWDEDNSNGSVSGYGGIPKPNISKDGRFIAFTSNWRKTLGRYDLFIARVTPAPVLSAADDFNDNQRDAGKWNVASLESAASDPAMPVTEVNQKLRVEALELNGSHANGYTTAYQLDLTNRRAQVELVQLPNPASFANAFFTLVNGGDWYRFMYENGVLYLQQSVAGVTSGAAPLAYDSTQHRHWRIRHDLLTDLLYWETSGDGVMWVTRHSAARQNSITSLRAELYVRTWRLEQSPGAAEFDNFKLEAGPWMTRDVGTVGLIGSATASGGTITVEGAGGPGGGIWYSTDVFRYTYQQLPGDGQIVARVTGLQSSNPLAKAGLMIREGQTGNARHASLLLTPGNIAKFQRRVAIQGDSTNTDSGPLSTPYWLKLTRSGNLFTAYVSSDGVNWGTAIGSETISMTGAAYIGLAVSSNEASSYCTATFDNVVITAQ